MVIFPNISVNNPVDTQHQIYYDGDITADIVTVGEDNVDTSVYDGDSYTVT